MNVTFTCPHCHETAWVDLPAAGGALTCPHCSEVLHSNTEAAVGQNLERCLICPSTELFVRKDFSQNVGVLIVVVGFVVSSIFWYYRMPLWTYGVLFATALIDVVLYVMVGNLLQCYRCQAQYRNVPGLELHEHFNLETHEKHRQQKIRLAEHKAR